MRTIPDALRAAAAAATVRGIVLTGSDLQGRRLGYDELLARSRAAASALLDAGLGPGDRLFLVLPTGEDFLAAFFGSLLAGIVPCPLSPPQGAQPPSVFQAKLAQLVRHLKMRGVLALPEVAEGAAAELGPDVLALTPDRLAGNGEAAPDRAPEPADVAFLQLTSGSTALPKGVMITHAAAVANLRQIGLASGISAGDVMVSWLPLFHDMGLVGAVLLALGHEMDLVLSNPFSFLRRPAHWVQAIHRWRGTHSLAPTFAFRQLAERLTDRDLAGLDLASWRVAYIGAEPVHREVLELFEQRLAPCGLSATTLLPCYGMAEATLAITFKPWQERYRTRPVSRRALAREGRAAAPDDAGDELVLVSCGRPLEGMRVAILDEEGRELPEGQLGEIALSGPSLFAGYFGMAEPGPEEIARGFRTGDLGFLDQGELFITGRRKELIILSGENHHPAEIEWAAAGVDGVRTTRVAAFGVADPALGTERLCILAESDRRGREGSGDGALAVEIRRRVREETGLVVSDVEIVPAGTIPVTTSGKIRRARAREIFLEMRSGVDASAPAPVQPGI
ncbi:MAG TPA: fatty acyl-AMP ligase [Thermoanaerobaculia bacterium]